VCVWLGGHTRNATIALLYVCHSLYRVSVDIGGYATSANDRGRERIIETSAKIIGWDNVEKKCMGPAGVGTNKACTLTG
jgi:hypothetical protein